MKRAAYHATYRADPKEKRAASRVASRASCLPPRVPLIKAYLCSCCMLWSARISWFVTETDSTYFTTLPTRLQQLTPWWIKKICYPPKMAETSNIKNISQNVSQCRDGKPWKMTQTRIGWHTLHTHCHPVCVCVKRMSSYSCLGHFSRFAIPTLTYILWNVFYVTCVDRDRIWPWNRGASCILGMCVLRRSLVEKVSELVGEVWGDGGRVAHVHLPHG